ncbi:hypothetical protein [Streptomyces cavernicola]|uniref:Uncharacterized protein n=1 Tax=Streptomyces cavernicola TaxID=3043613 RepID=A0ABT6SD82_9ACTN|nr:hypothetical protein [Streptomyces sp. B-S-A6]MDI3406152.1 hypothetical protein [Streptomyces sp. B-S-A6]
MPDRATGQRLERRLYLGGLALMAGFALLAFGPLLAGLGAVLLGGAALFLVAAWRGASALRAGRTRRAWQMFAVATAPVSLFGLLYAWVSGKLAVALDAYEPCIARRQHYDAAYRERHLDEMDGSFPLSNACNADHDLVPGWVNPALVCFAVLLTTSVLVMACMVVTTVRGGGPTGPLPDGRARQGS